MNDNKDIYSGPSWDNSNEYTNFDAPELKSDLTTISALLNKIENNSKDIANALNEPSSINSETIPVAWNILKDKNELNILLSNIYTFASCATSVDGKDENGKRLLSQMEELRSKASCALQPYLLWLVLASDSIIEEFLKEQEAKDESFIISRARLLRDTLLPLEEEKLLKSMAIHGITSFGTLYNDLSSTIQAEIDTEEGTKKMGMAAASALLESSNSTLRKSAYKGINKTWQLHEEACSASLNSINGWRHEINKRRSHTKDVHFLDEPIHLSRIEKKTLDAMFSAVRKHKDLGHRVIRTKAKILNLEKLGPWDLFAPFPSGSTKKDTKYTYNEAIEIIKKSFNAIDPDMKDFVSKMDESRWIEGSTQGNKRPGAYCTKFLKTRTPRVYMTYAGSMKDIITLAHELGHAHHNWLMRDLPLEQIKYPMTLAETASTFAQTVVNEHLCKEAANDKRQLLSVLWNDAKDIEAFILNIPVRFEFEDRFNTLRSERIATASELKELMKDSWQNWYEDNLSEMNEMFWASKLHFHISSLSFYNFPYTFGYLFSLGVYSLKEKLGDSFYETYSNLLRDTGKMTAEDLAKKYLDVDLTSEDFWNKSLEIVKQKVEQFESLASEVFS